MAIYYPCPACQDGRHEDCHHMRPPSHPEGFDGWMCSCDCWDFNENRDEPTIKELEK